MRSGPVDKLEVASSNIEGRREVPSGSGAERFKPPSTEPGLIDVTLAELSVPMLVVAPTREAANNPEVVRLVALARAGDRAAFGRLIEDHLTAARRVALAAVDARPDELAMSRELAGAIAQVVRALPRRLRDPFLLAASGDHRYEEIATMLGTPIGTVKWRISEARRLIRLKLDHLGHGAPR